MDGAASGGAPPGVAQLSPPDAFVANTDCVTCSITDRTTPLTVSSSASPSSGTGSSGGGGGGSSTSSESTTRSGSGGLPVFCTSHTSTNTG